MSRLSATCGITSRRSILIALFAAFSLVGPLGSVRADITPTGDVEPDPSTLGSYTTVYIGNTASGTLTVDSGSNLLSGSGCIGNGSTATGLVNLTGSGSGWTINGDLCVGNSGSGTLSIASGGSVASGVGGGSSSIGANFGSTGIAKIDGLGSAWTIADNLLIGNYGSGTLSVSGGGSLTPTNPGGTTTVSISGTSLLSIDTGRGSSMAIAGGTGTFTNNGTIRILAGAGAPADGVQYSPILAGSWGGTGTYQAIGGTWNSTSHKFTASSITLGTSGTPISLDLATVQRAIVTDNGPGGTNWKVGASFPAAGSTTNVTFTATAMNNTVLDPGPARTLRSLGDIG